MLRLGDYVRASDANQPSDLDGVYIEDLGHGYILLEGMSGRFVCKLQGAVTISDQNVKVIPDAWSHLQRVRRRLQK